jgi:hypothetical protein
MTIDSLRRHPGRVIAALSLAVLLISVIGILVKYPSLLRPAPSIPFEHMDIEEYDLKGAATIESPYYVITFDGNSFQPRPYRFTRRMIKGRYFDFPPSKVGPDHPLGLDSDHLGPNEVDYGFSAKDQVFLMKYRDHLITFSCDQQKLTINDQEFSTAAGRVNVTVDISGRILESTITPTNITRTRDPSGFHLHATTTAALPTEKPTSTSLPPLD